MTGIDDSFASDPHSPITRPVAGCVVRFSPDFTKKEIVADGFRNAYGMDFNLNGDLFTYDSDNERCVELSWYEPTRFYHVIPGSHDGWRSPQKTHFWRMPPYFPDLVKPLTTLGRGSPTGVTCYQHQRFPPQYHGAMFLADWTFGRVYVVSLKQSGSSYGGESHVFIQAVGSNGFAPTDIVVHHPSGELYVSTGGRGTRGAVYRIRYTRNTGQHEKSVRPKTPSRTASIGGPSSLLLANMTDPFHIRKTLHWFRKHYEKIPPQDIETLILKTWDHHDRYIRQACAALIALMNGCQLDHLKTLCVEPSQELTLCQGIVNLFPDETLKRCTRLLTDSKIRLLHQHLELIRLVQLAHGGLVHSEKRGTIWEGYTFVKPRTKHSDTLTAVIRKQFPTGHRELDRELSRTLAALEDSDALSLEKITNHILITHHPVDQIHYLTVLARLKAVRTRSVTPIVVDALLDLGSKITALQIGRDRHWPLRMEELHRELSRQDANLNKQLSTHPNFGQPDHLVFTRHPDVKSHVTAIRFLEQLKDSPSFRWTESLIEVLKILPDDQLFPLLREQWENTSLHPPLIRT